MGHGLEILKGGIYEEGSPSKLSDDNNGPSWKYLHVNEISTALSDAGYNSSDKNKLNPIINP